MRHLRKNQSGQWIVLIILFVLMLFSILASITFGNAEISVGEVYKVVMYEIFHIRSFAEYASGAVHDVVWLIRFPRAILALTVGMGLAVCGAVMQAVVKNQLADPYILGISSGSYMGATFAIMFGFRVVLGMSAVGLSAFIGAVLASFSVLLIANTGGPANAGKLVLTGMAVNAVCMAFANFAIYIANNKSAITEIMFWTMGSLAGAKWSNVAVMLPLMTVGTLIFWSQFRNLNLMLLGDEVSITLGTNLRKARIIYMILTSLLVGSAVNVAGMIGFVGLIMPHAVRIIFGTDHKRLIPLCALGGGIFLIWADVLSRVILKNAEMPIGILVSLVGAPCFIYLMMKRSHTFGGGSR